MMIDTPLSDAEFALLDAFFLSDDAPINAMDSVMLDGYLAAVVSAPTMALPSEWLRWVWDTENGIAAPTFSSTAQARQIKDLLMRHCQDVDQTLTHAPAAYEARLYAHQVDGRTVPIIDEWCVGYFLGMSLDMLAWAPLLQEDPALMHTVMLYGTDAGWDLLKKRTPDLAAHQVHADGLATVACRVHAFWLAQRRTAHGKGKTPRGRAKPRPLRSAPTMGRDEPCPCGSGKQYQHCHAIH